MASLVTVEGQVEEPVDSPERIQRIKDGVRLYLEKDGALNLRWDGPLLRFQGKPERFLFWTVSRSKLCRVIEGRVSFRPENGRLFLGFCLSFRRRIVILDSFVSGPPPLYFHWNAEWYFKMAITRGLTEVAIKEIEDLRVQASAENKA